MPLSTGDTLGPYEILAPIGKGGMGEVYKARDTRLDRTVAIKVLPEHIAKREGLRARFEREARAVASLKHPNICVLHDIGSQDGAGYMVMEFMEGETLADRIGKGALPLDQALKFATQIADALDRAHRAGVTHRDVKPQNIMLTRDGAKVLDFGLAKSIPKVGPTDETLTAVLTTEGTVMGTPQYMAPEQFEGKEADARSDIWAFGAVLYEMVTGQKAFQGKSYSSLLGAILSADPPPISVKPFTPVWLERLVRRCLQKDPDDRYQNMRDVVLDLSTPPQEAAAAPQKKVSRWPWAVAVAMATLAGLAFWAPWRTPPEERAVVLDIFPGRDEIFLFNHPAIAPDGHAVALRVLSKGAIHLAIRSLDSNEIRTLPGTESANYPDWSPDSRSLVFNAGGKLKRVDVAGGPPQVLCDYNGSGIPFSAWSASGVILFSGPNGEFWRVSDQGGTPARVTTLDTTRPDLRQGVPQFLPDGKRFLYFAQSSNPEKSAMVAASLDEKDKRTTVMNTPRAAFYARGPTGDEYLLFRRDSALVAQPFDSGSLKLTGEAFLVLPEVTANNDHPFMAVSASGTMAYSTNTFGTRGIIQLRWKDRSGKVLGEAGPPGAYVDFSLSPDEMHVALDKRENGNFDIHLMDLSQKALLTRFTFDPANDQFPIWLRPHGRQVTFRRNLVSSTLLQKAVAGTATENPVIQSVNGIPLDWSWDGHHLLYSDTGDLYTVSGSKVEPFLTRTSASEAHGQFSPDGKWIVFDSDESGRQEVWMQPYPATGAKFQISTTGGSMPRWRADGRELYFVGVDQALYAVPITLGASPQWGAPARLFQLTFGTFATSSNAAIAFWPYSVSANGQKFLVMDQLDSGEVQPLTVVTNWLALAKRK